MKTICLTLLAILTLVAASGQSTTTSSTADSLVLTKYQANTSAILDSLIRFEFTKQKFQALAKYNTSLLAEKQKLSNLSLQLSSQNDDCWFANNTLSAENQKLGSDLKKLQTKYDAKAKKSKKSALEKWTWRGAAIIGIALKLNSII